MSRQSAYPQTHQVDLTMSQPNGLIITRSSLLTHRGDQNYNQRCWRHLALDQTTAYRNCPD